MKTLGRDVPGAWTGRQVAVFVIAVAVAAVLGRTIWPAIWAAVAPW